MLTEHIELPDPARYTYAWVTGDAENGYAVFADGTGTLMIMTDVMTFTEACAIAGELTVRIRVARALLGL